MVSRLPSNRMWSSSPEGLRTHLIAGGGSVLILCLLALPLLRQPFPDFGPPSATPPARLQLSWLPAVPPAPVPRSTAISARPAAATASSQAPAPWQRPMPSAAAPPTPAPTASGPNAGSASPRPALYQSDGRVRLATPDPAVTALPPGTAPGLENPRQLEQARRLLQRKPAIDYRQTRFDQDWASDGNLFQRADQALSSAMKSLRGKRGKSQPAVARPPPQVRFNPALHERPQDLGSEQTGDAYKAAPIPFEPLPDLHGSASARLEPGLHALESASTGCTSRLRTLLAPAREHLAALKRIEHALAHGADPVMAEHLLPRQAEQAWDLTRRALWYARRQLREHPECRPPPDAP